MDDKYFETAQMQWRRKLQVHGICTIVWKLFDMTLLYYKQFGIGIVHVWVLCLVIIIEIVQSLLGHILSCSIQVSIPDIQI